MGQASRGQKHTENSCSNEHLAVTFMLLLQYNFTDEQLDSKAKTLKG